MKRLSFTVLVAGLVTACGDPSAADTDDSLSLSADDESGETHTGDGDGDTGDGDGDTDDGETGDGDGDGDTGDGDGDGFEPIPDGLFADIPGIYANYLAVGPDHMFARSSDGLLRISKQDATYEIYTAQSYNGLTRNGDYLYTSGASTISRATFDADSSLTVIGSLNGVGGLNEIVFTTTDLFVRRDWGNDGIYRFAHDGGPGTALVVGEVGRIESNDERLFGTVNGNLVEFDTQTGAQTLVFESVTRFHVGADRLFFARDYALHSSSFAGDQVVELVSTTDLDGSVTAHPVAADEHHLYWSDAQYAGGKVGRVPLDGGEVEVLHTHETNVSASSVRLDTTHIYWVTSNNNKVRGIWRYTK